MMEFAVVLIVKRKMDGMKIRPKNEEGGTRIHPTQIDKHLRMMNRTMDDFAERQAEIKTERHPKPNTEKDRFFETADLTTNMDVFAFFIFSSGFLVFNCIYWKQSIHDFHI